MVSEARKQSIAWMEHRLQISLKRYAFSMEDVEAGAFGRARSYGRTASICNTEMDAGDFPR